MSTAKNTREECRDWGTAAARAKQIREGLNRMGQERATRSSLRELHNAVFDIITKGKGRGGTVYAGRGAWTYDLVGRWIPGGVVGWMMGLKNRRRRGGFVNGDLQSAEASQDWEKVEHA